MATPATPTPTAIETRIPAMPPPPGATSNFDHPKTLVRQHYIAMGIALPFVAIPFLLRCYVRLWRKRVWILEDWLALIAWIGTVSFCGTGASNMAHYGGRHSWDITQPQAQQAAYWFNIVSIHYGVTICFVKLTILWLYRRVFSPARHGPFDVGIVSLVVFLVGFYVATNLAKVWQCVPREKIWVTSLPGSCIDISTLLNVSGVVNTVTDFVILLLPIKAVWNLNLAARKKITVVLVFTFGLSLAGLMVRWSGTGNPDKTWVHPEIIMWGLAELTTGVLCFSVPELGLLLRKKPKPGPSESILQGRYLKEGSAYLHNRSDRSRGSSSSKTQFTGLSTIISSRVVAVKSRSRSRDLGAAATGTVIGCGGGGGGGGGDYYELDEREGLGTTSFGAQHGDGAGRCSLARLERNGVIVTRDFRVETSRA
ncbi:hypothetical protein PG993_003859 [Apiospora rasikravindrae]|uniref:Rhodopsin domain-containing protein n=1 Tax=Apiospora rasikravindrae TaxID=990691 RepID=A0ABR1U3G9_9PEZI